MAEIDKTKELEEILKKELDVTDEEIQAANRLLRIYILVQGKDWEAKPYWAYMAIPPVRIVEFQDARAKGNNALLDFGEILKFGYGDEPQEEIKKEMEAAYGMQHDFVDIIDKELQILEEEDKKKQELKDKYAGKKTKPEEDE